MKKTERRRREFVFEGKRVEKEPGGGGAGQESAACQGGGDVIQATPTCRWYRCWRCTGGALHTEDVRQAEQVAKAAGQRRLVKLSGSWSLLILLLHLLHLLHLLIFLTVTLTASWTLKL